MSRKPPEKSGAKPGAANRIDVTTPGPALTQSPFAALAAMRTAPDAPAGEPASPPVPSGAARSTEKRGGRLILRRETKHRGGKTVVIVSGFAALGGRSGDVAAVASHLKGRLGCGGSSDAGAGEILIQGDRPAEVAALLRDLGYEVAGVTR